MQVERSWLRALVAATAVLSGLTTVLARNDVPRAPDGHPDLDGYWDYGIATPLERPDEVINRKTFTPAEAQAIERVGMFLFLKSGLNVNVELPRNQGDYEASIPRRMGPDRRTSLIIDPPWGRIPPLTHVAKARESDRAYRQQRDPYADPEALTAIERCLAWTSGPPPLIPAPYNNFVKIVQTPEAVVIASEMIHDARVVPLDGRPHLPPSIRQWRGDSRGRWVGDTLVVDTVGFIPQPSFLETGPNLHVVERFKRIDAGSLRYEFTIDDPESFTQKWTAAWVWKTASGPLYEYACHEGNHSIVGILKGARADEIKRQKE